MDLSAEAFRHRVSVFDWIHVVGLAVMLLAPLTPGTIKPSVALYQIPACKLRCVESDTLAGSRYKFTLIKNNG